MLGISERVPDIGGPSAAGGAKINDNVGGGLEEVAGAKGNGMDTGGVSDMCVRMIVFGFRAGECSHEVLTPFASCQPCFGCGACVGLREQDSRIRCPR